MVLSPTSFATPRAHREGESGDRGRYRAVLERKQDVLNDLTDILGLPRWVIKRPGIKDGSSIPSHMFAAAAMQVGVAYGGMPETNERIIREAGLPFDKSYDSRQT